MTKDEVINMAIQAGWHGGEARSSADALQAFAELLAERLVPEEREACAKLCDVVAKEIDDTNGTATYISKAIRSRGQQ